jgi:hypothetical protein
MSDIEQRLVRAVLCLGPGLSLVGPAWAPTAVEGNMLPAIQHGLLLPAVKTAIKSLPAVQHSSLPAVQHRIVEKGTIGGNGGAQDGRGGTLTKGAGDPSMGDGSVRPGNLTNVGAGGSAAGGGGGAGVPAVQLPAVQAPVGR